MSAKLCKVIVYGDSLILTSVRHSLENCPDLKIILMDQSQEEPFETILDNCPAAFVFDLEAIQPDFQLSLLQLPGLLLIGIDPETHQALVWSGRQEAAVQVNDLVSIIRA
jgi:hypothetical protein